MGVFGGTGPKPRLLSPKKQKRIIFNMLEVVTGLKRKQLLNQASRNKWSFSDYEDVKKCLDRFYLGKKDDGHTRPANNIDDTTVGGE